MRPLFKCRRTVTALVSIMCLTIIALVKSIDTSAALAAVAMALAGANASESVFSKKEDLR
jgi:hypothetical protein